MEQLSLKGGGFERLDRYLPRVFSLAVMAGVADDDDEMIDRAISGLKDTMLKPALSGLISTHAKWVDFREAAYRVMNVTSRTSVTTVGTGAHVYEVKADDQEDEVHVEEAQASRSVVCFGCQQPGHIRPNCPNAGKKSSDSTSDKTAQFQCDFHGVNPSHGSKECTMLKMIAKMVDSVVKTTTLKTTTRTTQGEEGFGEDRS